MKENIWSKTTLSVYRYLERICNAIDKLVEQKAVGSFYVCTSNFYSSSVMNVADKIIALSERKKTLINLKVLTEKALKLCEKETATLLIEKYIDNDKSSEIAKRHNLPMRTYFRRLTAAERTFNSKLTFLGYPEEKLEKFLAGERWIMEVHDRFTETNDDENLELNENKLNKLVLA